MTRFLLPVIAAIVLAFSMAAAPANATTISLVKSTFKNTGAGDTTNAEQINPHEFDVSHQFGSYNSSFVDTFKFTMHDLDSLNIRITTWNHVVNMNFQLFDSLGNNLFSLSGFAGNNGDTHVQNLTFTGVLLDAMLASPYLTMKITGAFCSCAGYNIAVFPLPPALLMFLTALVGLGGLAWHQRRNIGALALAH